MIFENKWPVVLCIILMMLAGAATNNDPAVFANPYDFLSGIWHGLIAPITLWVVIISSLLSAIGLDVFSSVSLWGAPNTGIGYWIGYFLGAVVFGFVVW